MAGHDHREVNAALWKADRSNAQDLFNRLQQGETITSIAKNLNVSHQAVRQYLLNVDEDAYHNARQIAADYQMIELEDVAKDETIDCARARNIINVGQFKLERRYSKQYGRKDQLDVTTTDVTDRLHRARKRVSEDAIDITPDDAQDTA